MRVDSPMDKLLFTTVRIETHHHDDPIISTGTGFLYRHVEGGNDSLYLVTNKHVLEGFHSASFFFTRGEGDIPVVGDRFDVNIDDLSHWWVGHPDDETDVAVISMAPVLDMLRFRRMSVYISAIDSDLLISPETLREMNVLEEVIFVGYPNGIYDTVNLLPLIRRGITSTPLQMDYDGKPIFLIDASVFPGSSGSPVFIANTASFATRSSLIVGNRLHFVGLISSVATATRQGTIEFIDVPTALTPIVKTQDLLDLGIVFKAGTVLETITEAERLSSMSQELGGR